MTRKELADLPDPKYLLYPHQGVFRGLMALPVIAFAAYLVWFLPVLLEGRAELWHWIFFVFLGVMTVGVFLPKSRDWRSLITFAATPDGAWFVTGTGEDCVFLSWNRVHGVYEGDVRGRGRTVKGIVFEIEVDPDIWDRLNQNTLRLFEREPGPENRRRIGLSANLRKPAAILKQVERFRNMGQDADL